MSQASAALVSVFTGVPGWQDELEAIDYEASQTPAGRGSRLLIAVEDLGRAMQLLQADESPETRALAQSFIDNALPHLGRILGEFDHTGSFRERLGAVCERYGHLRGPAQLDYLEQRGAITPELARELRPQAGALYREAFASAASRPLWRGIALLERAERAREALEPVAGEFNPDSDQGRMAAKVLKEMQTFGGQCQKYLTDPKARDHIALNGPRKVTRGQMVAEALTRPRGRALNSALERADITDRHRELVGEVAKVPAKRPLLAVTDAAWLDQVMNYQGIITGQTQNTIAVNSSTFGILVAPAVASDAISRSERGGYDETFVHELVHTTQPDAKGKPLRDEGPALDGIWDRHRTLEAQLIEGATQALTNHLRETRDPSYMPGESGTYPAYTAAVDEACALLSGQAPERFYAELSSTPTNQRTALLARRAAGIPEGSPVPERLQRELIEQLLPAIVDCELDGSGPAELLRLRQRVRAAISGLRG